MSEKELPYSWNGVYHLTDQSNCFAFSLVLLCAVMGKRQQSQNHFNPETVRVSDLPRLSISQLRQVATHQKLSLQGITKKADILARIQQALVCVFSLTVVVFLICNFTSLLAPRLLFLYHLFLFHLLLRLLQQLHQLLRLFQQRHRFCPFLNSFIFHSTECSHKSIEFLIFT